ncbi:MAG: AAA family ATPase, partial [Spirochaetes bacterium]|nr:AAA family ATPase [Spirochaetota bacterium]
GYFISGKYDRFKRNIPYIGIIQAFEELIDQILTKSEEDLIIWKDKILKAVGNIGQVIIDIIPYIELIIGKQPKVQALPPTEAQNRFNLVFQNFINVFAKKEHPLVLFIDDLQWADNASLKLIEVLLNDPELNYFLFISAYRDNEVDEIHALSMMVENIKKSGLIWEHIKVKPLGEKHITHMLADTLYCDIERTKNFAKLTALKTGGNPFFTIEFLKSLYENNLINFKQGWIWDLSKIRQAGITDNVVELMANKIKKLPKNTWNVIKLAACKGIKFYTDILALIYDKTEDDTFTDLKEAINEGLIIIIGKEAKFVHDRVREAAYSLIDTDERKQLHYKIGKTILTHPEHKIQEDRVFVITNQLNLAKDLLNEEEKRELITLNLKAGQKAKTSAAFDAASNFFKQGLGLLSKNSWEIQYDITLSLYTELAESEYMATHYESAEKIFDLVLKNAKTLLDKSKTYQIMLIYYTNRMQYKKAVNLGIKVTNEIGLYFPKVQSINLFLTIIELIKFNKLLKTKQKELGTKEIEDLVRLPELLDPLKQEIFKILFNIGLPCYSVYPDKFPCVILKLINISFKYGFTSSSCGGLAPLGNIFCVGFKKFDLGYKLGKLGLKFQDKYDNKFMNSIIQFNFGAFILHWKKHAREALQYLESAYQDGVETGNNQWAAYSINHLC